MRKLTYLTILLFLPLITHSQSSFQEVLESEKGVIHVHYFNLEPSCFEKDGQLQGIDHDLIRSFAQYVERKYDVLLEVQFFQADQFPKMYRTVRDGKGATFGSGSLSITQKRLQEINFTPAYFPDIEVLITSSNIPLVKDQKEFIDIFQNLKGIAVEGTTLVDAMDSLKSLIPDLEVEMINDINQIIVRLENEPNLFAYKQLATYLVAKRQGLGIKRQNLFPIEKEGGIGIAYPLSSDWKPEVEAFFADSTFKATKARILAKYLGNDVNEIVLELASNNEAEADNITLLNKEVEFQNLQLQKNKLEIGRQELIRNFVIGGIILTLIVSVILFRSFQVQQKNNKLLQNKNDEIEIQKKSY